MKVFNIILLLLAYVMTILLAVFGGDVVSYLQNIVLYLTPIANAIVFNTSEGR